MNSHRSLGIAILLISAAFMAGLAPSAKADEIYSFTGPKASWSFRVPSLITLDTTGITSSQTIEATFLGAGNFSGEGLPGLGEDGDSTTGAAPSGVSEPASLLLLGGGLASLAALRRRKRIATRQYLAYQEHGKRAIRLG